MYRNLCHTKYRLQAREYKIKELLEPTSECKGLSLIQFLLMYIKSFEIQELKQTVFLALFACTIDHDGHCKLHFAGKELETRSMVFDGVFK